MVQMSAVKILNFLVNDMLDYAQLSAGQFRKLSSKFNLATAINEILEVMNYKAEELGIKLTTKFRNFAPGPKLINEANDERYQIIFDQRRLQ